MSSKVKIYPDIGEVRFVKRSGQKSISISPKAGYTRVSMPKSVPYYAAEKFLASKKQWVLDNRIVEDEFLNGMAVGKQHILRIEGSRKKSHIKDGVVYAPDDQNIIRRAIQKALKQESEELLEPMLRSLSALTGQTPNNTNYKPMKSRWGSCSSNGLITINIFLVQLPWDLIEYVLIHELSHLSEMNHGKGFWDLVESFCPDYKARRKVLKTYSPLLYNTSNA